LTEVGVPLERRFRSLWFDTDVIVHGSADPLLTAEITFCRLRGRVSKQELNLVRFSSGGIAQLRAPAPQIMWGNAGEAEFGCILFHYVPD